LFFEKAGGGYDPTKVVTNLSQGKEKYRDFEHFFANRAGERQRILNPQM